MTDRTVSARLFSEGDSMATFRVDEISSPRPRSRRVADPREREAFTHFVGDAVPPGESSEAELAAKVAHPSIGGGVTKFSGGAGGVWGK